MKALNNTKKSWLIVIAVLVGLLTSGVAMASERPSPNDFMKERMNRILEILAMETKEKRVEEMDAVVGALIDYDDLAVRSLGDHWEKRTPEEQEEYKTLFKELVRLTYVKRLTDRDPKTDYEIEWDRDRVKDDMGYATNFVLYEDTETELAFTLKGIEGDTWIVYDLAIDGASVEDTYRRNYGKIIDEEGYPALVQKMKDKIAELKE